MCRYNSAIFLSLAANSFNWLVVTPGFLNGAEWNLDMTKGNLRNRADEGVNISPNLYASETFQWPKANAVTLMQADAMHNNSYTKIDTLECLKQYNTVFGNRSDLLLVSNNASNNSVLVAGQMGIWQGSAGDYWCRDSNTFDCNKLIAGDYPKHDEQKVIENWNFGGYKIEYCLASYHPLNKMCILVFSYRIMIGEFGMDHRNVFT